MLQSTRQIHLLFGVFIAPALIFFAFSGALQTFSLHETTRGSDYKPPHWAMVMAQVHKKQSAILPQRHPGPSPERAEGSAAKQLPTAALQPISPQAKRHPLPLRIFFLVVCIGLITSTVSGVYMAYKYNRDLRLITGLLLAGTIIPVALIFV